MPSYNDQNRSRSSQHRSDGHPVRQASQQHSSRQAQRGERRPPRQGHPSNQRGQRSEQRPYRSARNARTMNGHDAGYTLHQRSINFNGSHGITNLDRGSLLLIAGALVILLLMIFAISSCVRSCSTPRNAGSAATSSDVNTQDARVAVGASADVTSRLTPALDNADALTRIAKHADDYTDTRMIDLAVNEPAALSFVANYPGADKTSSEYTDSVTKGTYPVLYDWDSRWGYIDYADGALGVTGSGPTTLAMAYMGLTGKTDQTPATIANTITDAGANSGESGMKTDFFENGISRVGLASVAYSSTEDDLYTAISNGTPVAALLKANTLTSSAHWVLITGYAEDDSLIVYDPTSATASSHTWDAGTIAASSDSLFALSATASDNGGATTNGS